MSAIAGIFRFDGNAVDRRDLERMMNALQAHGPDRRGSYAAGPVALAHLLMRMTPEDLFEAQPVRGASGAIMAADLRLDNRDELISALGLDRRQAADSPDSAIALAAWEKWGDDAWARLRGPFAIALWDSREHLVTLVRDPVGLRALCYYIGKDFIAFATMPKGLFALADVPRVLNKEKFADFLIFNHSDCETSLYENVFRLHPAHAATIDVSGRMTTKQYWGEANITPVRLKSDQAYAEAIRERLDIAVRRHLRATHKVGCFLSGGLDSSSVAALAARAFAERNMRLPAYTQAPVAEFQRPPSAAAYFDERPYVEAIRERIGNLDVTYVCSGEYDDFADQDRIFHAVDGPVRNVANMGWITEIYRRARAENQRVLLGGDLGNVTISWDGWDQAFDCLVRGRWLAAVQQWRLFYQLSTRSRFGAFHELFIEPSRVATPLIVRRARGAMRSPINPQFARDMQVVARAQRDHRKQAATASSFALSQRLNMISGIEFRGEWEAGILALHGVDLRDPTSDLDVAQFCLGIPDQQYLAEGINRSVIRRAMWNLLPPTVLANRKRGLQAADWFGKLSRRRETMADEVRRLRTSSLAAEAINLKQLERLVEDWPRQIDSRDDRRRIEAYQFALLGGLSAGRFLQLFERSNPPSSSATNLN